ncbi:MAG: FliI/YscN family ATPase, partial [Pseudomonadota bacterium]
LFGAAGGGKSTLLSSIVKGAEVDVVASPPDPLTRKVIDRPVSLQLRVVDGLLTLGEGQRVGLFGAAGGGKSTLLSSIVKGAEVDVVVIALIGERGREVREFIEHDLGPEGMAHAVLVVATSDRPAMERAKAAYLATSVAEYFRDQGQRVLLLMDSVTRFARALREIGLAAGEPPTRRGFPPSVFATLPKLLERAGQSDKGSISAIYTVLVEGDDMSEPVADETRSILDGHIILSRALAQKNHYPAIDVLASTSRVMNNIVSPEHRAAAGRFRELLAKYNEIELLVQIGEYQKGGDPVADEALSKIEALNGFLRQGMGEFEAFDDTLSQLEALVS